MGVFDGKQILNASVTSDKMAEDVFANMPIASSDEVLTNSSAGLKTNLSLVADGSDMVLYGRDNIELGRVNIAIGNIQNAYYDSANDEIVIVVVVQGGTDEIRIPADDLIDIYTGKEYIDVDSDNVISLNYELVKDQLIIDGVNTGINISDYYTSAQVNSLVSKYLPLEGGTVSGDLTVNGVLKGEINPTYKSLSGIDIDTLTTPGFYYMKGSLDERVGTYPREIHSVGAGMLVLRNGAVTYTQLLIENNYNDSEAMYIRSLSTSESNITPWAKVAIGDYVEKYIDIPENSDLNDYTEPGFYRCARNEIAGTISNLPQSYAFSLTVQRTTQWEGCCQFFVDYRPHQSGIYFRKYYPSYEGGDGTGWGEWQKVVTGKDLSNYLPLTGGNITGDLTMTNSSSIDLNDAGSRLNIFAGNTNGKHMYLGYEVNDGVLLNSGSKEGITLKTTNVIGGNIKLITPTDCTAYLNGTEIATIDQLPDPDQLLLNISGTHTEILALKTNSSLVVGRKYIITDYQTIYKEVVSGTELTGETPYTLILTAITTDTFDERVVIAEHPDWECHYKIDATSSDYGWVTANSKGCIYRLIDSYKNSFPYDFKNVKMRRYKVTACPDPNVVGKYWGRANNSTLGITVNTSDYKDLYTFDLCGLDASQNSNLGYNVNVVNNHCDEYLPSWTSSNAYQLPDNVLTMDIDPTGSSFSQYDVQENEFLNKTSSLTIFYNDSYPGNHQFSIRHNRLYQAYYNNYIGCCVSSMNEMHPMYTNFISTRQFSQNVCEGQFYQNIISTPAGVDFGANSMQSNFYGNKIYANCTNNVFEGPVSNNIFNGTFNNNQIGQQFYENVINANFNTNQIGQYFSGNTIHNQFLQNVSDGFVQNNTFGVEGNNTDNFSYNHFKGNFLNNVIGNACKRNVFDSNFGYDGTNGVGNTIGNGFFKNVVEGHNISGIDFTASEWAACYDETSVTKLEVTRILELNDGSLQLVTNTELSDVISGNIQASELNIGTKAGDTENITIGNIARDVRINSRNFTLSNDTLLKVYAGGNGIDVVSGNGDYTYLYGFGSGVQIGGSETTSTIITSDDKLILYGNTIGIGNSGSGAGNITIGNGARAVNINSSSFSFNDVINFEASIGSLEINPTTLNLTTSGVMNIGTAGNSTITLGNASREVNINSSKATYNSNEIATVNDIPDTSKFVINKSSSSSGIEIYGGTVSIGSDANQNQADTYLRSRNVYISNVDPYISPNDVVDIFVANVYGKLGRMKKADFKVWLGIS